MRRDLNPVYRARKATGYNPFVSCRYCGLSVHFETVNGKRLPVEPITNKPHRCLTRASTPA